MEQTTNYNLNLPEETDTVDINVLNENFETIDEQLKLMEDSMTNNDTLDGIQSTVDNNNELLTNTYNIVNSSTYGNSAIKSSIDTIDTNIQSIENKVDNLNDLEINYSYASRENESTTTYLKVDYFRADRNANSHFTGNTGYVSKIRLKIKSGYSGSSVFVTVYEVEKKDSLSEDIIKEKIYDEQEFEIIQTEEYGASIDIPINRTYSTAHYFLIGSTTQAFVPSVLAISTEDPVTIELSNIPEVSNTGMVSTGSSYSLFQTIYGGSESLGQILQNTARASEVEDITNITTNTYSIVNSSTYGNSSIKSAIDTIDDNIDTINTNVSSNKSTLSTINSNTSTTKTTATNTYNIVNSSTYGNEALYDILNEGVIKTGMHIVHTGSTSGTTTTSYSYGCTVDTAKVLVSPNMLVRNTDYSWSYSISVGTSSITVSAQNLSIYLSVIIFN